MLASPASRIAIAAAAVLAMLWPCALAGAAAYFQVPDGDWSVAGNWAGGLPSSTSVASVGTTAGGGVNPAVARIGADVGAATGRVNVTVGVEAATAGTVIHTAGTAYLNPTIGSYGTGSYVHNGGTLMAGQFVLGKEVSGVGTYSLNDATLTATGIEVGSWGTGTFSQIGGSVTVSSGTTYNAVILGALNSGASNYGKGTYNLAGDGVLTIRRATGSFPAPSTVLQIGRYGTGTFNIGNAASGGTVNESGTTGAAGALSVKHFSAAGYPAGSGGLLNGWGMIDLKGVFTNNGVVRANGYGTDRTLNISAYSSLSNGVARRTSPAREW